MVISINFLTSTIPNLEFYKTARKRKDLVEFLKKQ